MGKPGSGKSTLMKEIHSSIEAVCSKDTIVTPFFFKNSGTFLQKSFEGMLRVFVSRILQQAPNVENASWLAYRRTSFTTTDDVLEWPINDLKEMLRASLTPRSSSMHLIFLVDALDECEGTSITELLSLFKELCTQRSRVAVKICISSRQIPPGVLVNYPGFSLEEKTVNDIANWIDDKLLGFALDEEHNMLTSIKQEIIKRADGIFLWVELTLKQLCENLDNGDPMASYRKSLSELPGELTELFDNILKKVPARYHKDRDQLLGITLCCRRPMNIAEVRIAMALSMGETVLSSHCEVDGISGVPRTDTEMTKMIISRRGGLLEIKRVNDTTRIVQFIHQSVKDYLAEKEKTADSDNVGLCGLFLQGHTSLSKACIRYCMLKELKSLPLRLRTVASFEHELRNEIKGINKKFPFLDYAVNNWMQHCEEAEHLGEAQTEELLRFEKDEFETFETWLELYNDYAFNHRLSGRYNTIPRRSHV